MSEHFIAVAHLMFLFLVISFKREKNRKKKSSEMITKEF